MEGYTLRPLTLALSQVFVAIKRTSDTAVSPSKRPHGNIQNVHLIELSLISSNCVIRGIKSLQTSLGLTRIERVVRSVGLTIYHILNRQSTGAQKHYCFIYSNEIP